MDHHIEDFFSTRSDEAPKGHFHNVIPLHDRPELSWNETKQLAPLLPRGWFELSRLSPEDRIDFTHEFWLSKIPYHPKLTEALNQFFSGLDVIGIFLTQQCFDDPHIPTFIYSLSGNKGYYCGSPPTTPAVLTSMKEAFPEVVFPEDYLSFMAIHDGFRKATDCTGIIPLSELKSDYDQFQAHVLEQTDPLMTSEGKLIDPKTLIPFYESFGMPFYQCFWSEWHPEQEMANVYYSGITNSISEVEDVVLGSDSMSFLSFTDWLLFYLEQIG